MQIKSLRCLLAFTKRMKKMPFVLSREMQATCFVAVFLHLPPATALEKGNSEDLSSVEFQDLATLVE
jgi:hypothetical protein